LFLLVLLLLPRLPPVAGISLDAPALHRPSPPHRWHRHTVFEFPARFRFRDPVDERNQPVLLPIKPPPVIHLAQLVAGEFPGRIHGSQCDGQVRVMVQS
jgi:hypothetical protein